MAKKQSITGHFQTPDCKAIYSFSSQHCQRSWFKFLCELSNAKKDLQPSNTFEQKIASGTARLPEKNPKAPYLHLPSRALEVQACLGHSVNMAGQELVFKYPGTAVSVRVAAAFGTTVNLCKDEVQMLRVRLRAVWELTGQLQGCPWLWHMWWFQQSLCQTFQEIRKL